jgi:hypothetical protein
MILGVEYDVRCIKATAHGNGSSYFVPVLGEPHIDPPCLGLDGTRYHWHLDYRFMTDEELKAFLADDDTQPAISISVKDQSLLTFKTERRKMLREFKKTVFLSLGHREFEKPFIGRRAVCGRCPHQGMKIDEENAVEINGKKRYICPGHHLVFTKKLRVIPSPEKKR